jgi:FAD/FMN-containing dehydrogenase
MELELKPPGIKVLRSVQQALDPERLLNPGKLGAMKDA